MRSLQSCKSALTVTLRGKAVFAGVIQRRLVGCGRFSRLALNATGKYPRNHRDRLYANKLGQPRRNGYTPRNTQQSETES